MDLTSLTKEDYDAMAGPDWPSYDEFVAGNQPEFVQSELTEMFSVTEKKIAGVSKTFCIIPFYNVEYPWGNQSCMLPGLKDMSKIKKQLLSGERPHECSRCWEIEDAGLYSDRQLKNKTFDWILNKNIEDIYEEVLAGKSEIVHYKIDTNNTCNAACITCASHGSTHWAKYEKLMGITPAKAWEVDINKLDINYRTAKTILFRGGESLLSKLNFEILENLTKANNTECFISFTTNGSIKPNSQQLALLQKFKNVNFCFSIDGIDSVFEYMRFPLKWPVIVDNINFCRSNGIDVSANFTISNMNIMYYNDTARWFKESKVAFHTNPVCGGTWYQPSALHPDIKSEILNRNPGCSVVKHYLGKHTDADDAGFKEFLIKIRAQDLAKGINGRAYMPEFFKLVDSVAN